MYDRFEMMTRDEERRKSRRRDHLLRFMRHQTTAILELEKAFTGRGRHRSVCKVKDLIVHPNALWEFSVPTYSPEKFQKKFRLKRSTFNILVRELGPALVKKDTNFQTAIPVPKRIAIALYYLKSNASADIVSDVFKVGHSTVHALLHEFCDAVVNLLFKKYVVFPESIEDKRKVADDFLSLWQFPNTFGSLDGTHIPIIAPMEFAEDYWNYKNYHSIVLMALVDARGKFIYTNIGRPGKANDAGIFNDCALKQKLLEKDVDEENLHIIGDGAFALMRTLMKPYIITADMPNDKEHFNKRLSRARVSVEDAFGRLKGRFRILMKRADFEVKTMVKIVKTCVVLHNLCEEHKEKYYPSWNKEVEAHNKKYVQPHTTCDPKFDVTTAAGKRDHLCELLFNDSYRYEDDELVSD